jgi:hypothetical protein
MGASPCRQAKPRDRHAPESDDSDRPEFWRGTGCGSPLTEGQSGPCPICGDIIGSISAWPNDALPWQDSVETKSWALASFAESWFSDALQVARVGQGRNAMRREIVFAVIFAETYLYEFVRDVALKANYEALSRYFRDYDSAAYLSGGKRSSRVCAMMRRSRPSPISGKHTGKIFGTSPHIATGWSMPRQAARQHLLKSKRRNRYLLPRILIACPQAGR